MIQVDVQVPGRHYPVVIGDGARSELATLLPPDTRRVAVVTQASIPVTVDPGCEFEVFHIGDGEEFKTLETIGQLCSAFAQAGFSRADCVVGVGGGIVTTTSPSTR